MGHSLVWGTTKISAECVLALCCNASLCEGPNNARNRFFCIVKQILGHCFCCHIYDKASYSGFLACFSIFTLHPNFRQQSGPRNTCLIGCIQPLFQYTPLICKTLLFCMAEKSKWVKNGMRTVFIWRPNQGEIIWIGPPKKWPWGFKKISMRREGLLNQGTFTYMEIYLVRMAGIYAKIAFMGAFPRFEMADKENVQHHQSSPVSTSKQAGPDLLHALVLVHQGQRRDDSLPFPRPLNILPPCKAFQITVGFFRLFEIRPNFYHWLKN